MVSQTLSWFLHPQKPNPKPIKKVKLQSRVAEGVGDERDARERGQALHFETLPSGVSGAFW